MCPKLDTAMSPGMASPTTVMRSTGNRNNEQFAAESLADTAHPPMKLILPERTVRNVTGLLNIFAKWCADSNARGIVRPNDE